MKFSTPPRVVFDTNILISAIVFGGAPRLCLELARQKEIIAHSSQPILIETGRVLRVKFAWSQRDTQEAVAGIKAFSTMVSPLRIVQAVASDPSDNRILEAACACQADYIVSGDKRHLLSLVSFEGIPILSASAFLEEIYAHSKA